MTGSDAYLDDMRRLDALSDAEIERLFAGGGPADDPFLAAVGSALTDIRALAAAPRDEVARRHIAMAIEAARVLADKGDPVARPVSKAAGAAAVQSSRLPKWRIAMDRAISLGVKAGAGMVAASLSMMGFAYAGVDLPGTAAERALEAVTGVELPNQGPEAGTSVDDTVREVVESDLEGCEKGQAVAEAARSNAPADAAPPAEHDPCTQGDGDDAGDEDEGAGRANAAEKSQRGRTTAGERSNGRSDAGAENAESAGDGEGTAGEASSGRSDAGAANRDAAPDDAGSQADDASAPGEEASESGQSQGEEASESGQSQGEEASESGQSQGEEASESGQSHRPSGAGGGRPTEEPE